MRDAKHPCRDALAQCCSGPVDRIRVDILAKFAGNIEFAGQGDGQRSEGRISLALAQQIANRIGQTVMRLALFGPAQSRHLALEMVHRQGLQRLPAVEGIAVMAGEGEKCAVIEIKLKVDGRGKAPQQRGHFAGGDPLTTDAEFRLVQNDHFRGALWRCAIAPLHKAKRQGNDLRALFDLARRWPGVLAEMQRQGLGLGIIIAFHRDMGRAGLIIPLAEMRQIAPTHFGKTGDELLDGRGVTIVTGKIEIHALLEGLRTDDQLQHPDDFSAFFIDRRRVEIVDLAISPWPHRMGEGACILDELAGPQFTHIHDALDGPRALVGGKLLIAKHRQAFLEAELEPIPAGDAVAGPVVEILMGDDRLDERVIRVCRGLG